MNLVVFFSVLKMFKSQFSDSVLNKVEMTFYEVENEIHFFIESTMFRIRDLRK